ncbi:MAG: hypothetical protein ACYC5S_01255 [Thiobacillus sp.]
MSAHEHDPIRQQVRDAYGAAARADPGGTAARGRALHGLCRGAAGVAELTAMLAEAGFADIRLAPKTASREFIRHGAPGRGVEDCIASAMIEAVKPVC